MGGIEQLHLSNLEQDWADDALAMIGNLTQLRDLSLLYCRLQEVPRSWCQLDLEALSILHALVQDRLTGIGGAERLLSFKRLRKVHLWDSRLEEINVVMEGLWDLTHFTYSIAPLKRFPDQILRFLRLESLHLQHCGLIAIPPEIGGLSTLRYVNLSGNPLQHKPSGISRLSGLEHLWLQDVPIQAIASDLPLPVNLKTLGLGGCPLQRWPDQVLELGGLETLSLPRCGITDIPSGIACLPSLTALDLSDNRITSIPSEIIKLSVYQRQFGHYASARSSRGGHPGHSGVLFGPSGVPAGTAFRGEVNYSGGGGRGQDLPGAEASRPKLRHRRPQRGSRQYARHRHPGVARQDARDRRLKINVWDFGGQEIRLSAPQRSSAWEARSGDRRSSSPARSPLPKQAKSTTVPTTISAYGPHRQPSREGLPSGFGLSEPIRAQHRLRCS